MNDIRLQPAHRRKLRRMRALVDAANSDPAVDGDALAAAASYLATHATCEQFLLARDSGQDPSVRPRCGQGFGKRPKPLATPKMRTCSVCKKRKSVISFDEKAGTCIKCKYKKRGKQSDGSGGRSGGKAVPMRSRKCPVCLQNVTTTLVAGEWTVDEHTKVRRWRSDRVRRVREGPVSAEARRHGLPCAGQLRGWEEALAAHAGPRHADGPPIRRSTARQGFDKLNQLLAQMS
ncbi:hypothetical protein [Marmoricola sp. OAE513]|uniref:hypothetical protein n=1 Tax=Marmoricola sp. OAE513 TaxID=2817894 RepID=UPI0033928656